MSQAESSKNLLVMLGLLVLLAAAGALFLLRSSGSGDLPNTVRVQGSVTFQGQPLKMGMIMFEPDAFRGGTGAQGFATIVDGQFDTKAVGGQAASLGPCILRVTGGDGVGVEAFTPFGKMLFEEFSSPVEIVEKMEPLVIEVPAPKRLKASVRN